jgi:hypothetical protein
MFLFFKHSEQLRWVGYGQYLERRGELLPRTLSAHHPSHWSEQGQRTRLVGAMQDMVIVVLKTDPHLRFLSLHYTQISPWERSCFYAKTAVVIHFSRASFTASGASA